MTPFVKNLLIRAALTAVLMGTLAALSVLTGVWGSGTLGVAHDYVVATAAALAAAGGALSSAIITLLTRLKAPADSGTF